MAFHDTEKNSSYHSLFIKLFGHVLGGRFFRTRCIKHPVLPDWVKPSSVNFDIRALWRSALSVRVPGCQKITKYSSTPSGTGCFMAVPYGNSGRQRVTVTAPFLAKLQ